MEVPSFFFKLYPLRQEVSSQDIPPFFFLIKSADFTFVLPFSKFSTSQLQLIFEDLILDNCLNGMLSVNVDFEFYETLLSHTSTKICLNILMTSL